MLQKFRVSSSNPVATYKYKLLLTIRKISTYLMSLLNVDKFFKFVATVAGLLIKDLRKSKNIVLKLSNLLHLLHLLQKTHKYFG